MTRILLCTLALLPGLTAEVHTVVPQKFYRTFDHRHPVIKRIRPGDKVVTTTLDSGGKDEKSVQRHESGNPLTGPFFIEGAEPGDAIVVRFDRMRLNRNWGHTSNRLLLGALLPEYVEGVYSNKYKAGLIRQGSSNLVPWDIDLDRGMVRLREPVSKTVKFEYPAKPMMGCVGVAAPGDFAPTSGPAGNYGGNLDYNMIGEGVTVILPVFHPGGLFFLGDGHAIQGDGEATGTGVETSLSVEFTIDLRKKAAVAGPRVITSDAIISVGAQPEFASSLDRALQMCSTDMVRWLVDEYGVEPWAAHLLVGYQAKYDVVTVMGTMALRIPKSALPAR